MTHVRAVRQREFHLEGDRLYGDKGIRSPAANLPKDGQGE